MPLSLSILNNVPSLVAQDNLFKNSVQFQRSLERLSSGLKINRGADGPAALVISENIRAQVTGLRQVLENTQKDAAVVQIAEGGLDTINALLNKARALALDSANTATQDPNTFAANQAELDNILQTINGVSANTTFGSKGLLDGSSGLQGTASSTSVTFLKAEVGVTQVTSATNNPYAVTIGTVGQKAFINAATSQAVTTTLAADELLTVNGVQIQLFKGMTTVEVRDTINQFTSQTGVTAVTADSNGLTTRLQSLDFGTAQTISVISDTVATTSSSGFSTSAVTDLGCDIAGAIGTTTFTGRGNVLTANQGTVAQRGISIRLAAQTGISQINTVTGAQGNITVADNSLVFQIGSGAGETSKLSIDKLDADALSVGLFESGNGTIAQQFNSLSSIRITSNAQANDALVLIDNAIAKVTNLRGSLGAIQRNSLEATGDNIRNQIQNQINADSVIRDTDYAVEIATFAKFQVLLQTGTAVLGNANQLPQLALTLLQG